MSASGFSGRRDEANLAGIKTMASDRDARWVKETRLAHTVKNLFTV